MLTTNAQPVIFAAGLVVAAVVLTRLLRPFINYMQNAHFERTTMQVKKLRDNNKAAVKVRQTDITSNMTSEDRAAYRHAESLISAGRVKEAATILEAIRFRRKAIDILEAAGHIDEACGVLIRLNAAGRAGVLFERNNMLDKAAHCYTLANQHESAGKVFVRLGAKNYRYFVSAMDSFSKAQKWDSMIAAAAEVLATAKIVEAGLTHGKPELVSAYLSQQELSMATIPNLGVEQVSALFKGLPLTPRHVLFARNWVQTSPSPHLDKETLVFVHASSELCSFFWSGLEGPTRARLAAAVADPNLLAAEIRAAHAPFAAPTAQAAA